MSGHEQVAQQQKTTQVAARMPAVRSPAPAANPDLLGLQRAVGNRAVLSLLHAQASLMVGPADDPYEREADAVARQVTAQLRQAVARPAAEVVPGLEEDEGVARVIHRHAGYAGHDGHIAPEVGREGGALSAGLEHQLEAARTGGSALPSAVRGKMEGAFGVDFSGVRVHEGSQANDLNRKLGAQAFTVGSDIFFGGATPSLSSTDGSSLLAHELTHVVQQGAAGSGA